MVQPLQRLADLASKRVRSEDDRPWASSLSEHSAEEEPYVLLLLGLGLLGRLLRACPEDVEQLAAVGTDVYLLVAVLATDDQEAPPSPRALAALAMKQLERYTSSSHGERWTQYAPLEHLSRAFRRWTAWSGEHDDPGSLVHLADLANYLMFFLASCGALDELPGVPAKSDSP